MVRSVVASLSGILMVGTGLAWAAPTRGSAVAPPAVVGGATPLDKAYEEPPAPAGGGERYVGVAPGGTGRNPLPRAKKTPPRLIWSGFKSGQGSSRVFFQTNLPVRFEMGKAGARTMSLFLRNCRIHLRNNARHLDTRFFATPVEGVTAVQRRRDVELRIELKEPSTPTSSTEPGPDGTQFVVLEFPPGTAAADDAGGEASSRGAGNHSRDEAGGPPR